MGTGAGYEPPVYPSDHYPVVAEVMMANRKAGVSL